MITKKKYYFCKKEDDDEEVWPENSGEWIDEDDNDLILPAKEQGNV